MLWQALLAPPLALLDRRAMWIETLSAATTIAAAAEPPDASTIGGTVRPLRSLASAARDGSLGRPVPYPDPILRRTASPVRSFGPSVGAVADLLAAGIRSDATSALQYGIDARMVVLKGSASPISAPFVLINPTVLSRSGEDRMVSWLEYCLVLSAGLEVELLRDEIVEIAAQDVHGVPIRRTLSGESARAFQHELDHLDGILIVDYAGLDDLPGAVAGIEAPYHAARQRRAFERNVYQGNTPLYW